MKNSFYYSSYRNFLFLSFLQISSIFISSGCADSLEDEKRREAEARAVANARDAGFTTGDPEENWIPAQGATTIIENGLPTTAAIDDGSRSEEMAGFKLQSPLHKRLLTPVSEIPLHSELEIFRKMEFGKAEDAFFLVAGNRLAMNVEGAARGNTAISRLKELIYSARNQNFEMQSADASIFRRLMSRPLCRISRWADRGAEKLVLDAQMSKRPFLTQLDYAAGAIDGFNVFGVSLIYEVPSDRIEEISQIEMICGFAGASIQEFLVKHIDDATTMEFWVNKLQQ